MRGKRIFWLVGIAVVLGVGAGWIVAYLQDPVARRAQAQQGAFGPPNAGPPGRYQYNENLDVPYVPTPERVVDEMLKLAAVTKDDVVYDLGCGDGRIVITAAKRYGARGVGVDIDPQRIKESNANARKEGVTDRVKFIEGDLFKVNLKDATVVTLYLLPEVNLRLRPKLFRELRPGTRVVSHDYDMGNWEPAKTVRMNLQREHTIYFWTVPEKADQPASEEAGAG